jgi:hypothetical protein
LEGAGWLRGDVSDGETELSVLASYFSDPLLDLLDAVLALWYGAFEAIAVWWEEPFDDRPYEYMHWRLTRDAASCEFQLLGDQRGFGHTSTAEVILQSPMSLEALTELVVDATRACAEAVTDEEYRREWYAEAERSDIFTRFEEIDAARRGARDPDVLTRLRTTRPGQGGYWSDLAPPIVDST